MSKLSKHIERVQHHQEQRVATYSPLVKIQSEVEQTLDTFRPSIRIKVEASLGHTVVVPKYDLNAIELAIKNVRAAVVEEVFGEFRKLICEAQIALSDLDYELAKEKLSQLYKEMFEI